MENFTFEGEQDSQGEQLVEHGEIDSTEEAFIRGYSEEDNVIECAECGAAVNEEKKVIKEINDEEYIFCSELCAKEFAESIGEQ